ncbi:MAG: hypothetical protein GEU71_05055 [Actinobacteria bacterium]|nr:hypothetical protein [Actinomycetota bacterium]
MRIGRRIGWCITFALLVVALAGCGDGQTPSASSSAESEERCEYPSVRPTYLPWQRYGEIPEPDRGYDDELDLARLLWINPGNQGDAVALTLYPVNRVPSTEGEEPLGVLIGGNEGYLHNGPPDENGAWWALDQTCNFLELIVSMDGLSPASVDEQVVKVARSLEE